MGHGGKKRKVVEDRQHLRKLSYEAFTSAAEKLQRNCFICEGDGCIWLPKDIPPALPSGPVSCENCHGTGFVGPTALELAEKLQNGALAGILAQLNRGNAVPIWVKELFDKLDNLPGKEG